MTETCNSFHVASSLCHTSSAILDGEGWWASFSATQYQMFSMGDRSHDHADQGKRRSEYDVQNMILHYHVGRGRSARLDVRAHALDGRCQKHTDTSPSYRRSELEMFISLTQ
ncbi:hypothetical protein TNCV_3245081 [Trichonephila clavipes]|nr:hypothetical protein TNCV_3245081 [Trichonephila clavipes]